MRDFRALLKPPPLNVTLGRGQKKRSEAPSEPLKRVYRGKVEFVAVTENQMSWIGRPT